MDVTKILDEEGIYDYEDSIQKMTEEELLEEFSFKSGNPNATKTIKNIIWQAYTWIQDDKRELIDTNLRGFWYTDVKPVLSRMGYDTSGSKYLELVYDAFVEMVTVYGLFSYKDFGFIDESAHMRIIGKQNGHLIIFCEKTGLFPVIKEISDKYDITAVSLGGFPSLMETENLVWDLRKFVMTGVRTEFILFSIVDYDPAGYWIEKVFRDQLDTFGIEVSQVHPLIQVNRLEPERLEYAKYKLKESSKTTNWLEKTGGINGEPYGLEANAFKRNEIIAAFEEESREILGLG